jgi:hypothetical protein
MSLDFREVLALWLPDQEDAAARKLRNRDSTERDCDFARGQLDMIEKLTRAVVSPKDEFGNLWTPNEEDEGEDENAA